MRENSPPKIFAGREEAGLDVVVHETRQVYLVLRNREEERDIKKLLRAVSRVLFSVKRIRDTFENEEDSHPWVSPLPFILYHSPGLSKLKSLFII